MVGKLNDKLSKNKLILYSVLLLVVSWLIFLLSAQSIVGLIIGIVGVDLGLQALHIANQNIIFFKNPEARNRVNTIYMVGFFLGGAVGTIFGALAWEHLRWMGVSWA